MSKSHQSFNKKEKEKKRRKKKEAKLERREQRKVEKEQTGPKSFEDMLSYVDENGNLSSTPPDPAKKKKIKAEDIVLGIPPKEEGSEEDRIRKGAVKFFNHDKGYGFIIDTDTNQNLFVHMNNTNDLIKDNDKVTFEIENSAKGPTAVNVSLDKS